MLLLSLNLLSCATDVEDSASSNLNTNQTAESIRLCTTIDSDIGNPTGRVSYRGTYWEPGQTIRIKFLNGDEYVQNKVKQCATEWLQYSNLKFEWVTSNEIASIKIAFKWKGDESSWSKIGKYSTIYSPSMNYGWFDNNTPEQEFRRVITHEFGHALGFAHEHQNPISPIQWNTTAVYNYYAQVGWDKERVNHNILNKFSANDVDYTDFDEQSIMLYSFPSYFTLNGYSTPWNTFLSDEDKASANKLYPPDSVDPYKNKLFPGQILKSGESFGLPGLYSYVLKMTSNGNLQISKGALIKWHTKTDGNPEAYAIMQTDGNFVVMSKSGKILWSSGTSGNLEAHIQFNSTGYLEIKDFSNQVIWRS
jgi:hypothetical protein